MNRLQWLPAAPRPRRPWTALTAAAALLGAVAASADLDEETLRVTPARVAYVDGDVSFWRPGAGDWEAATVNIPLAAGDALATRDGHLELQVGPQAFLRAGEQTQVRVKSQEPDFLQVELSQGSTVLDLRHLPTGHVVEIDTPQAAVTVDRDGFYRVDVDSDATRLTVRRAGTASLTPSGGQAIQVATGEAVSVRGGPAAQFDLVAAPAFDEWDRWNYARADSFLAAPRSSAVATDVYGAADLDRYGSWRYAQTYGRVWVPSAVPVGWAPYTAGRWLWDPVYGWSWVDYAPWGWAPFHYGRWVYPGYWAWAPGPVLVRPVYAPALVAFFGPAVSISVGFGVPYVSWVALGWGEPLVPWWGGVGFYGVPCWRGWGGPQVVNNIVINNGDTVHAEHINMYRNADAPGGLVGVPKDHFGGTDVQRVRLANLTSKDVKPSPGAAPRSTIADTGRQAVPKGALPELSPGRSAAATRARAAGQFSRQAPTTGGAAGASAAPPKPAVERAPYERLRSARTVEAARAPLPKQALPSVGARTVGRSAAPPPLRGMAKPEGGSADAYRRVRNAAPAPARAAVASTDLQRVERAPAPLAKPAEAPPSLETRSAPSSVGTDWSRAAQPAPKASAYGRAPTADFAPVPKAPSMPNLGGIPGGGGSMGGGGIGGSPVGGGAAGGGGGGGGGRPNFSR